MLFTNSGYSHGGRDLVEIIQLFFKGVLLFPVFLFAIYIGGSMLKHMIFHGLPAMNAPTEEQRELMRDRDSRIGLPNTNNTQAQEAPPRPQLQQPPEISPSAIQLLTPKARNISNYNAKEWVRRNCEDGTGYVNGYKTHGYFCTL